MVSPVNISAVSPPDLAVSDPGSHTNNPAIMEANPGPKVGTPPECEGAPLFGPGDGDIQITINGRCFETHKFLIKHFRGLKLLLGKQSSEISIKRADISAEDFCEMFKVLYASIVTGPFGFTSHTLISTLRIATIYEYQMLRDYCIKHLEALELDAVKRVQLAHEFHIPAWEEPAYHELAVRTVFITREEARIIGMDALMSIVEMREEQQRRWKEINTASGQQDEQSPPSTPSVEGELAQDDTMGDRSQENISHPVSSCVHPPAHEDTQEMSDAVNFLDDGGTEIGPWLAGLELSGLGGWKIKHGYAVEIPSCKCRFANKDGFEEPRRSCLISSCAISTLKAMHIQQIAHAKWISNLQVSVQNLDNVVQYL
ncbi:hypothetical protein ACGC1H_001933 [Rhizoctonia solani]